MHVRWYHPKPPPLTAVYLVPGTRYDIIPTRYFYFLFSHTLLLSFFFFFFNPPADGEK